MTLYLPDSFQLFETSHELTELIRELLEAVGKRGVKIDPSLLRRAREMIGKAGFGVDDTEFIDDLVVRLQERKYDDSLWRDLSQALRILARTELRLYELTSAEEPMPPTEAASARFAELARSLMVFEGPSERRNRDRRQKAIRHTLEKRPGLYVTELYRELIRFSRIRTTYATVWNDVHSMEAEDELLTIGGPQGTPRYCFPHPAVLRNRRAYYENFMGTTGVVKDRLTDRFDFTRRYIDLFLVNSLTQSLILVLKYGAAKEDIIGAKIKTFGRLHPFDFLRKHEGLEPRATISPVDVLRVFSIARVEDGAEQTIWHNYEAFTGFSLYSGSMTAAM